MSDEPLARARWLGALLIVLLLALLIRQAWLVDPASDAATAPLVLAPQAASNAVASLAPPPTSSSPAADEVELCGPGRTRVDAAGEPLNTAAIRVAAQLARSQLLPRLNQSPDDLARAAGWLLQSADGAAGAAREALARMAASTRSAQVYSWALQACQANPGNPGEGSCQLLSAAQWARLDPGNAMPWLQVASQASQRGDTAELDEAMFRASRAKLVDAHTGLLAGVAIAWMPHEVSLLAQAALARELVAFEAAWPSPLLVASQYCAAAELGDANRQQTCAALAEVLAGQGHALSDLGLAAALGERVGWPAERVQALRDERDALLQIDNPLSPARRWRWTCTGLDSSLRGLSEAAQVGELAVLRHGLAQGSESLPLLAARQRQAAAQQVASAASAASAAASAPTL